MEENQAALARIELNLPQLNPAKLDTSSQLTRVNTITFFGLLAAPGYSRLWATGSPDHFGFFIEVEI
jgi:hypothetical protein